MEIGEEPSLAKEQEEKRATATKHTRRKQKGRRQDRKEYMVLRLWKNGDSREGDATTAGPVLSIMHAKG